MQEWTRKSFSCSQKNGCDADGSRSSNEKLFQGGLVFKAHRLLVSLNSRPRVIKKKQKERIMAVTRTAAGACVYLWHVTVV